MAEFPFPPPDSTSWATWNVTFDPGAIPTDRDLDKAKLEQDISNFAIGPDSSGIICKPEFDWKDIDPRHSQLKVMLTCTKPDGSKVAERVAIRPPGSAKPPAGRVSLAALAPTK
jgi:hypothetical protein